NRGVARVRRVAVERLQAAAEIVDEPGVGAAVTGRGYGLVVPLEHAFGVREGTAFLDHRGGGQEKDLGRNRLPVYAVRFRVPLAGALGLEELENDRAVEP